MVGKILKLTLVLVLLPLLLYAQSRHNLYLKVDYLNVDHTQLTEFKDRIVPQLMEHKNDRLSSGDIELWTVYRVLFSGSDFNTYNYVSITAVSSMDAFDEPKSNQPDQLLYYSEQDMYTLSHSEIWRVRNTLGNENVREPSKFIMMDYMHVHLGRELEYQMLEDEVAKPLHEQRTERDTMDAWEMYQLITPGGLHYGYNFATGNYFSELRHIEFGFTDELIRSQNPDVNLMEFFDHIFSTRDLVRSEVWQRINYAIAEEEVEESEEGEEGE
ncbi:hypothetical protein BH23BAC3_BH23BAC3_06110 [soil metagenome]